MLCNLSTKQGIISLLLLIISAIPCESAVLRLTGSPPELRLEGVGLSQAATLDINIDFDGSALAVNNVKEGSLLSGAMVAVNTRQQGKVRIGAITSHPISGSGLIATLIVTLPSPNAPMPRINLASSLTDLSGKKLAVQCEVALLDITKLRDEVTDVTPESITSLPATGIHSSRLVTLPEINHENSKNDNPISTRSNPEPIQQPKPMLLAPQPPPTSENISYDLNRDEFSTGSPFARFQQAFGRITTLIELEELLTPTMKNVIQSPFPAIADGKTIVTLTIPKNDIKKPDVGVSNANILSIYSDTIKTWKIELRPKAGIREVRIYLLDKEMKEIYLAVAPPLSTPFKNFKGITAGIGKDLNGDGIISVEEAYDVSVNMLAFSKLQKSGESAVNRPSNQIPR